MVDASVIRERFAAVSRSLNERSRRLLVAAEVKTAGCGWIAAASRATGVARSTIGRGLKYLADPGSLSGVVRRPGSGRPTLIGTNPTLLEDLRLLLEPATMGDPERPLLWVSKSHAKLAAAFRIGLNRLAQTVEAARAGRGGLEKSILRGSLQICHYPPGTSKWNKIEHRLFCHITQTWRGKPLISRQTVVELIASTTTRTGLTVRRELDARNYPKGIKVSDAEMATLNIKGDTLDLLRKSALSGLFAAK